MEDSQIGELDGKFAEIRERVVKLSHNEENVEKKQKKLQDISYKLDSRLLNLATPEYPDDILELASGAPSPESGKYFDVVSLLSSVGGRDLVRNNGDRVALDADTFKGKYVLVCCFNVPAVGTIWTHHQVVNLCNELYATRDDFEMVMVARMNSLADDADVFHHFFSGFPRSCLAVPFEDNLRRDYICKVLDLGLDINQNYNRQELVFLNTQGKVVPSLTKYYSHLDYYGAEAFPFTDDVKYKSDLECREVVFGNASLERILRCNDSSPDFVYKINPRRVEMPVSQLSTEFRKKHVILYLCSEGDFLLDLLHMYEKCRAKNHHFEIVVVFQPFAKAIDPKIFEEKMNRLLKRHGVVGWWCLPFNNSVSRRFWRLARHYDTERGMGYGPYHGDKLIVAGPGVEHLDVYGACVMRQQGIDAFPFTIEAGIQLRMKELREVSLESLFGDVLFVRGNDRSDVVSLKELRGKKIFLAVDSGDDGSGEDYGSMASIYVERKATMEEADSFEMLYVDVIRSSPPVLEDEERNKVVSKMPWFVCPKNGANSANLEEFLRLLNLEGALVGFGEDGRIFNVENFGRENRWNEEDQYFSSAHTLHRDAEQILGYDGYRDHRMQRFANPRYERWLGSSGSDLSSESD